MTENPITAGVKKKSDPLLAWLELSYEMRAANRNAVLSSGSTSEDTVPFSPAHQQSS